VLPFRSAVAAGVSVDVVAGCAGTDVAVAVCAAAVALSVATGAWHPVFASG
jgi:hypothetical protein